MEYPYLILQNVATAGARRIAVFNKRGSRVGQIRLDTLTPPTTAARLYRFGALSDAHVVYDTAPEDLTRALTYLSSVEGAEFVCICGDLTDDGSETELAQYKAIVDASAADMPVYAIAGNHEDYANTSQAYLQSYTGQPLYYSFEHGGDLFVMMGVLGGDENSLFEAGELDWLEDVLNQSAERRRVFVFQHILAAETSGDVLGIYPYLKLDASADSVRFKSILSAHPNVIWFHGHTHMRFGQQVYGATANIDTALGCRSVHIPSIAVPRDVNDAGDGYKTIYAESYGYIVDVYEDGIHLRGRDFAGEEYLPLASYWIETKEGT